jgi:hypothetical protein
VKVLSPFSVKVLLGLFSDENVPIGFINLSMEKRPS